MADDDKTVTEDKPKAAAPRKASAKKEEPRESVVNDKVNMVDGKPEKIADGATTTESAEVEQDNDFAPTPWVETNDKLDNRVGDQQVDDAAWAAKPQHVSGGEVADKAKLDSRA